MLSSLYGALLANTDVATRTVQHALGAGSAADRSATSWNIQGNVAKGPGYRATHRRYDCVSASAQEGGCGRRLFLRGPRQTYELLRRAAPS